jgi:hypothetical protein
MPKQDEIYNLYGNVQQDLPAIKRCAFCGSAEFGLQSYGVIQVVCRKCGAEGPPSDRKLEPVVACRQAIERWNNRVPAPVEVH